MQSPYPGILYGVVLTIAGFGLVWYGLRTGRLPMHGGQVTVRKKEPRMFRFALLCYSTIGAAGALFSIWLTIWTLRR